MLWMERQRKYQSLPGQENVAGKSCIAEGREVSIKTIYFSALRFPYHAPTQQPGEPLPPQNYFLAFLFFLYPFSCDCPSHSWAQQC